MGKVELLPSLVVKQKTGGDSCHRYQWFLAMLYGYHFTIVAINDGFMRFVEEGKWDEQKKKQEDPHLPDLA